jgi:hypothetical protein
VSFEWVVINGIRVIAQSEMGEAYTSLWGRQRVLVGTPRMEESHEGHQQGRWVPRGGD